MGYQIIRVVYVIQLFLFVQVVQILQPVPNVNLDIIFGIIIIVYKIALHQDNMLTLQVYEDVISALIRMCKVQVLIVILIVVWILV